jgi:hypothetical protein
MSIFSRTVWSGLLLAWALPANTITTYELFFNGASTGGGAGNVSSFIDLGGPGYQVDGTLDVYDSVTGAPVLGTPLAGGFSLRFTDALISCKALGSSCASTLMTFSALINFAEAAPGALDGFFRLDGTGPETTLIASATGSTTLLLISNSSVNFNEFTIVPPSFTVTENPNQLRFDMALLIGGMADGESITLPSSLTLGLGNEVPEPGTLAIVGAGLAGALWFRRRLR